MSTTPRRTRPAILVTLDTGEAHRRGVPFPSVHMKSAYAERVEEAGGTPVLAAPTSNDGVIRDFLAMIDGLVVTGGAFDIDPARYGRAPGSGRLDPVKPLRTSFEWSLLEGALEKRIPVLGVCGGMQLLNVVLGGALIQDISSEVKGALDHEQPTSPALPYHSVHVLPGTAFHRAIGSDLLEVNSTHHQAVSTLGRDLTALGCSPDGIVEAIGRPDDLMLLGVQWHPELLDDDASRGIYRMLISQAEANSHLRR